MYIRFDWVYLTWLFNFTKLVFNERYNTWNLINRPVANLCSTSKIFERLILNRINELEFTEKIDLTNECQHGLSSSAKAIKACLKYCTNEYSYVKLHEMHNRAILEKYLLYKHALSLYKLTNEESPHSIEWVALNFNQILTSRQSTFKIAKVNLRRVGLNALSNRLSTINEKIPLTWLNLSMDT